MSNKKQLFLHQTQPTKLLLETGTQTGLKGACPVRTRADSESSGDIRRRILFSVPLVRRLEHLPPVIHGDVCFSSGSELMIESRAAIIPLHSQGLVTQLKTAVSPNVNNDNTVLCVHLWLQLQRCSFHSSANESDCSSFLILCAKRCRLSDLLSLHQKCSDSRLPE